MIQMALESRLHFDNIAGMFCCGRNFLLLWFTLIFFGALADPKKVVAASVTNNFAEESLFVCRTWRAEDGLPQESVWAITQTKDRYLWIGTGGGLARFDGVRFEVFGIQDGLPSMQIRSLLEDRSGALWIGTANGVSRFADEKFSSWTRRDGLAGESVTQLAEDGDGNIWIGSNLGLSRWHNGKIENIGEAAGLAEADVRAVIADSSGKIWVSLVNEGLLRFDGTNFVPARADAELRQMRPYRLLCDHRGNILAATVGKIYSLGETNWTVYGAQEGLPDVLISCLAESRDGTLWAGTSDQGMLFLHEKKFHSLRRTDGLSDDAVRSIAQDSEGNLWAGTRGAGLNRLQPRKLSTKKLFDGATEVQPISLAETGDGSLWIGTIGHGLHRFHGNVHGVLLRDELMPGNLQVSALLAGRDGSLWVVGGGNTISLAGRQAAASLPGFLRAKFMRRQGWFVAARKRKGNFTTLHSRPT